MNNKLTSKWWFWGYIVMIVFLSLIAITSTIGIMKGKYIISLEMNENMRDAVISYTNSSLESERLYTNSSLESERLNSEIKQDLINCTLSKHYEDSRISESEKINACERGCEFVLKKLLGSDVTRGIEFNNRFVSVNNCNYYCVREKWEVSP